MQEQLVALLTLITLEVVLGIDNIIFISILADKLPVTQRAKLRYWGMGLAVVMRLILLAFISWILKLDKDLIQFAGQNFTGKEIILIIGGLFLIYKSTKEIYNKSEAANNQIGSTAQVTFGSLLMQVILLDLVFSVDSIITAVRMANELWVMYAAILISISLMLLAAKPINEFISKHPSFKILALCFLMLIGITLIAEGLEQKIPKGYIYFGMAFSFLVDFIQMKVLAPKADQIN
jgi:predicted tellurium resistance membrane protein TerC